MDAILSCVKCPIGLFFIVREGVRGRGALPFGRRIRWRSPARGSLRSMYLGRPSRRSGPGGRLPRLRRGSLDAKSLCDGSADLLFSQVVFRFVGFGTVVNGPPRFQHRAGCLAGGEESGQVRSGSAATRSLRSAMFTQRRTRTG